MTIKKICLAGILIGCLVITLSGYTQPFSSPGQTLQINTHLQSILGKPEWVLIIRDLDSQQVSPYLFDFKKKDNTWITFIPTRAYQITASKLKWGPYATINNFCHLEKRILVGQSLFIKLKGNLSPNPNKFKCSVTRS